jgi:hypothetical protein
MIARAQAGEETTMSEFDPGPPPAIADILDRLPPYLPYRASFWYDWGPVFYRGRLDGSARVLCIASDPGPTERVAARTLVGDAGQRVQGFLTKIGLTRSYVCVNAFAYALFPSAASTAVAKTILKDPAHRQWRSDLFGGVVGPALQAIIAFGAQARTAVDLWAPAPAVPVIKVPHPSSHDEQALLDAWRLAIPQLRAIVTPDADGSTSGANYGAVFAEEDYARIPPRDLPFGVPPWLGDDAWGRAATPKHNNAVSRPSHDDRHTLIWIAPVSA